MSRHFHWQPSEVEDMPLDEVLDYFEAGKAVLTAEAEHAARHRR